MKYRCFAMLNRDTKTKDFRQHLTPRQVAEHMRSEGSSVGRRFLTYGAIWDAKDEQKLGLLHLILDAVEGKRRQDDALDKHREWLLFGHQYTLRLCRHYQEHKARILNTLCDESMRDVLEKSPDMCDWKYSDINRFAYLRSHNYEEYVVEKNELIGVVSRLGAIRNLEDLITLRGIGKKTVAKITERMKLKKSETAKP